MAHPERSRRGRGGGAGNRFAAAGLRCAYPQLRKQGPMALTKAQMAERLYEEVGLNKREAKEFVDAFFEVLREALQQGRQVKLSGFGNFDLRRKNERPGRNPKTGEEIPISARTVVTFRPGQKLKERVEAYTPEAGNA
ncbi:MAG: integration host factor subunit alpha [Gammaproteobacteria bacterium]|nr:integration host factor subunit alpha [Gammaproteobacteria bacterium]